MLRFTARTLPVFAALLQATVGSASRADAHELEMESAAASAPVRNLRKRGSTKKPLCFDLDDKKYGQYGMQTVSVPQENVRWFLRDGDVVSKGPCDPRKVETLKSRQTKVLSFCTKIGTTEYDIEAPRFLDSYLYERDAERGECLEKVETEKMVTRNSGQSRSNKKILCFDLRKSKMGEFGKQTLEVTSESVRWFLRDKEVSKGVCKGDGEELDRRELSTLKYCVHRGPVTSGYEVELKVPRFLDDYLVEKGGVERGGCRDSKADVFEAKPLPEINIQNSEK